VPKYLYRCENCENEFFTFHLMSEKLEDCDQCESSGTLKKLPSNFFLKKEHEKVKKVGDEVKTAIKEIKSDLKRDKVTLKNHIWNPDD